MGHGQNVCDKVKMWWDKIKSYGTECKVFIKVFLLPVQTGLLLSWQNQSATC